MSVCGHILYSLSPARLPQYLKISPNRQLRSRNIKWRGAITENQSKYSQPLSIFNLGDGDCIRVSPNQLSVNNSQKICIQGRGERSFDSYSPQSNGGEQRCHKFMICKTQDKNNYYLFRKNFTHS